MSRRLTLFSSDARPQRLAVLREGAFVVSVNAVEVDPTDAPRAFYADLPAALGPPGRYQFALYLTTGSSDARSRVRSAGEFAWDGAEIIGLDELAALEDIPEIGEIEALTDPLAAALASLPELAEIQTLTDALAAALDDRPTRVEITALTDAIGQGLAGLDASVESVALDVSFATRVLVADESYALAEDGTGSVQKTDRDSGQVLVDKVVTSTPGVEQSTTIVEV